MSSPIEQIKERLSIAEVVGSYVKLEKAGSNLKAKCPFHNERTASFFVSPARGSYYCFGCGAKGDILSFVQAFEGLDFMGALKTLAARAGVEIVREDPRQRSERERIFALLEAVTQFFQEELSRSPDALAYLHRRALADETIKSWRLGFAKDAWHSCLEFCRAAGFTDAEIEKSGISKTEKGKTYDRFRSRIMFPLFDSSGRVIAFSGRILGKESEQIPKYLNSPESSVFSKSRVLYGFDRAKNEIRRKDFTMLVEGQMDLLMCHQAGFKNTVASSGTAFTQEQIGLLSRLSKRLMLVYDADKAGIQASLRSANLALSQGMEVKVAALPAGVDPAELILKDLARFKESLRTGTQIIDFYLEVLLKEGLTDHTLSRAIKERLLPLVAALDSSIERDHFIARIANRTGVREAAIREDLSKYTVEKPVDRGSPVQSSFTPRRNLTERLLIGLVFWQDKADKPLIDTQQLRENIERIRGPASAHQLFAEGTSISEELIYQAESYYEGNQHVEAAVAELLDTFEEDSLTEELGQAMSALAQAEAQKNEEKKRKLLSQCQELTKRLNDLKHKRYSFDT